MAAVSNDEISVLSRGILTQGNVPSCNKQNQISSQIYCDAYSYDACIESQSCEFPPKRPRISTLHCNHLKIETSPDKPNLEGGFSTSGKRGVFNEQLPTTFPRSQL